jgi:hypothetical protein
MLKSIGAGVLAVTTMVAVVVVGLAAPAWADFVVCPSTGPCYVVVTSPGGGGNDGGGGGNNGGGGSGPVVCRYHDEPIVPCHDPEKGWYNNDNGCYYKVDTATNELLGRPGNYDVTCGPGNNNKWMYIGSLFMAEPPPGFGGPPSAASVAARAINALPISGADIGIVPYPDSTGLIGLPVWMWNNPTEETWGPIRRTATVVGVQVTAVATAQKIVWNMGDGHSVTCTTNGTRWIEQYGKATSPDCGYVYSTVGIYTVTATTYWHITWAQELGGNDTGELDVTRQSVVGGPIHIAKLNVVTG